MNELTDSNYWNNYWDKMGDKQGVFRSKPTIVMQSILGVFNNFFNINEKLNVIEIGGAPGDYLVYLHKNFKYNTHSLDFSAVGNEQTKVNFKNFGIPIKVYEKDIFSDLTDLPKFDIVFSLGFIEHFEDTQLVVSKHSELLKPGGLLLLGVPNFTGIYYPFIKRMAPNILRTHYLKVMHKKNWKEFENNLNLTCLYNSYIGGFEPLAIKKIESKNLINNILYFIVKILVYFFSFRMKFLRKINSRFISSYLIGVYRKN